MNTEQKEAWQRETEEVLLQALNDQCEKLPPGQPPPMQLRAGFSNGYYDLIIDIKWERTDGTQREEGETT